MALLPIIPLVADFASAVPSDTSHKLQSRDLGYADGLKATCYGQVELAKERGTPSPLMLLPQTNFRRSHARESVVIDLWRLE